MHRCFLGIVLLLFGLNAQSQSVGLVLSGGGAKGLAHIGVIKVLEEHNIPIDYIAGTSMGAIVAGLYASGMSPDEMIELFNSPDFRLWSMGKMDKNDLYYFKKNDEQPDWLKLDIAKKDDRFKLVLPLNIIPEGQMDFAFMQLMAQTTAACSRDFDQLMIPFRCVSTDVYHNKAVIHKSGDVGEAIRASMTFPLVYKPIEKDGMLLFDGGMVNNFPTDIMKEVFNPDIIIGHKVAASNKKPDMDNFVGQIETMMMQLTNYEIPDTIGILLETKLNDVGMFDFKKVNYINSRGVETALQFIDSIEKRIDRRLPFTELQKKREAFNKRKPELKFNNVQVEGITDNMQRKYIIQSIKHKDRVFNIQKLRKSYFKLIADEHIKSIRPQAFYNSQTGLFDLNLKVEPREPLDVEFGGYISSQTSDFGFIQTNLKVFNNRSYNLSSNLFFGSFYNSVMLGGRIDFPTLVPYYISGYFTLNDWSFYPAGSDIIFTDVGSSYIEQTEQNFKLEMGFPLSETGIIDFGISQSNSTDKYYQTTVFNESDEFDETTFKGYSGYFSVDKKNYDYKQFPTEGGRRMLLVDYVTGTESFTPGTTAPIDDEISEKHHYFQIKGLYDQYFKINSHFTMGAMGEVSLNNNSLFSNFTSATLNSPSFLPTPNSKLLYNEHYHANQYMSVGGKLIYLYSDVLHLRSEIYGFLPIKTFEAGDNNIVTFQDHFFDKAHFMASAAVVVQSHLGPLSVEVNYYDKVGQKWFFSINMGYVLFNKRGF